MIYINDKLNLIDISTAMAQLPEWRKNYVLKIKKEKARIQSVTAFILLKQALKHEYNITEIPPFDFYNNGKPYWKKYPYIHFNMSHCRTAVACALSNKPIGIDIESIRPFNMDLAKKVLNEQELRICMESTDCGRIFTKYWTIKEALLKLSGEGLRCNLQDIISDNSNYYTIEKEHYIYTVAQ